MVGIGYFKTKMGYNIGMYYRFRKDKILNPIVYGVFGTNAIIDDKKNDAFDLNYKSIGLGAGLQIKIGKKQNKRVWLSTHYILRDDDFNETSNGLKNSIYTEVIKPNLVNINAGFHLPIFTKKFN